MDKNRHPHPSVESLPADAVAALNESAVIREEYVLFAKALEIVERQRSAYIGGAEALADAAVALRTLRRDLASKCQKELLTEYAKEGDLQACMLDEYDKRPPRAGPRAEQGRRKKRAAGRAAAAPAGAGGRPARPGPGGGESGRRYR